MWPQHIDNHCFLKSFYMIWDDSFLNQLDMIYGGIFNTITATFTSRAVTTANISHRI